MVLRTFPLSRPRRLAGPGLLLLLGVGNLPLTANADALAQAALAPPAPSPWSGSLAAGYVRTSGNSDSSSLNAKASVIYTGAVWGNQLSGSALNGSKNNATTDERYSVADKVTYTLDPLGYLFGNGSYDNDRFSGFAERYVLTGGYGRHVLKTPVQTLDLEAGIGYSRTRERGSDEFGSHPVATLGGKYVWKLSPSAQFTQTLRTEISSNNTFVDPISELKLTVVGNLFAALNFELRYNTEVPDTTRHTDTISTVNLGYTFGPKK